MMIARRRSPLLAVVPTTATVGQSRVWAALEVVIEKRRSSWYYDKAVVATCCVDIPDLVYCRETATRRHHASQNIEATTLQNRFGEKSARSMKWLI